MAATSTLDNVGFRESEHTEGRLEIIRDLASRANQLNSELHFWAAKKARAEEEHQQLKQSLQPYAADVALRGRHVPHIIRSRSSSICAEAANTAVSSAAASGAGPPTDALLRRYARRLLATPASRLQEETLRDTADSLEAIIRLIRQQRAKQQQQNVVQASVWSEPSSVEGWRHSTDDGDGCSRAADRTDAPRNSSQPTLSSSSQGTLPPALPAKQRPSEHKRHRNTDDDAADDSADLVGGNAKAGEPNDGNGDHRVDQQPPGHGVAAAGAVAGTAALAAAMIESYSDLCGENLATAALVSRSNTPLRAQVGKRGCEDADKYGDEYCYDEEWRSGDAEEVLDPGPTPALDPVSEAAHAGRYRNSNEEADEILFNMSHADAASEIMLKSNHAADLSAQHSQVPLPVLTGTSARVHAQAPLAVSARSTSTAITSGNAGERLSARSTTRTSTARQADALIQMDSGVAALQRKPSLSPELKSLRLPALHRALVAAAESTTTTDAEGNILSAGPASTDARCSAMPLAELEAIAHLRSDVESRLREAAADIASARKAHLTARASAGHAPDGSARGGQPKLEVKKLISPRAETARSPPILGGSTVSDAALERQLPWQLGSSSPPSPIVSARQQSQSRDTAWKSRQLHSGSTSDSAMANAAAEENERVDLGDFSALKSPEYVFSASSTGLAYVPALMEVKAGARSAAGTSDRQQSQRQAQVQGQDSPMASGRGDGTHTETEAGGDEY